MLNNIVAIVVKVITIFTGVDCVLRNVLALRPLKE